MNAAKGDQGGELESTAANELENSDKEKLVDITQGEAKMEPHNISNSLASMPGKEFGSFKKTKGELCMRIIIHWRTDS